MTLPRWALFTVDLWLRCRARGGGGMGGGVPALPGPGGVSEQPAALMDAFDMLDQMAGSLRNEAH